MIVIEGTPGAGKTTLLGSIIERDPNGVVVLPEAQPTDGVTDEQVVADGLLAEDLERAAWANRIEQSRPGFHIFSDRCYIGILAYRYAMWRSGRMPRSHFDHALRECLRLGLPVQHERSTVFVLITRPEVSVRRRIQYAGASEYSHWFDPGFLEAYNSYLESKPDVFPENTMLVRDAEKLLELVVPAATGPTCPRCRSEPRSVKVKTPGGEVQLYARGLHVWCHGKEICVGTVKRFTGTRLWPGD